ncbi:MAG TPA: aminotransferase class IV [Kofleriaceae bacterium]|nr:aminotransferase class IV [Kofleriaceae bacterium]
MSIKIYIDGIVHDPDTALVPVFDRGFLYGDSVYEVMRTAGGRPVDLGPHLERLRRSGELLELPVPTDELLERAIATTLTAAGNLESYLRVVITRGAGEIGLDIALADTPRTIVIVRPLVLPAAESYQHGVVLWIGSVQRTSPRAVDPRVKSGNYLNNIMALREARRAGADEALMCDAAGRIAEGATSNIFCVRSGALLTPALEIGLLAGITRQRVIALARADGLEVVEGELVPDVARAADEAFITSSIRGVMPVRRIDDAVLGTSAPGPVTRRIMELYGGHLAGPGRA